MKIAGGVHGDIATAAITVNSIPKVLQAAPGLRTMRDMALPSYLSDGNRRAASGFAKCFDDGLDEAVDGVGIGDDRRRDADLERRRRRDRADGRDDRGAEQVNGLFLADDGDEPANRGGAGERDRVDLAVEQHAVDAFAAGESGGSASVRYATRSVTLAPRSSSASAMTLRS